MRQDDVHLMCIAEDGLLGLRPFEEEDCGQLIAALPDARSHVRWAGPEYAYPLDASQLLETLSKTRGERPSFKMYKAVLIDSGLTEAGSPDAEEAAGAPVAAEVSAAETVVGHAQLMDIDYERSHCVLGKVLIFPEWRGRGLGSLLVEAVVGEAFGPLGLHEMTLLAFDFNRAALAAYTRVGFVVSPPHPPPLPFEDESWQALRMLLTAECWAERRRS
jgi:RimJ/RimL family protein N-acetyltransferase